MTDLLEKCQVSDAQRFLSAIAPSGAITFQTLCTNKERLAEDGKASWRLNRTRHGSFAEHERTLRRLNDKGACVFFMVNQGDGEGRKSENVLRIRSIFVDLDGAPLEPVLQAKIPPSITVESSPGRFHAYWLVRDMPVRDFTNAQKRLAAMFDADPKVCDAPRLMRLPDFDHRKTNTAIRTRLITCEPELVWDWSVLAEALCLPTSMTLPAKIPEGERNMTLFKLVVVSHRQGIAKDERLKSILALNAARCEPPLPEAEVMGIVDRVYRAAPSGALVVPLSLLSCPQFVMLDVATKLLVLLSYQRASGGPERDFPLLWPDFRQHFKRERTFGALRQRAVAAGLLRVTRRATKPRGNVRPQPALYKLAYLAGGQRQ